MCVARYELLFVLHIAIGAGKGWNADDDVVVRGVDIYFCNRNRRSWRGWRLFVVSVVNVAIDEVVFVGVVCRVDGEDISEWVVHQLQIRF